ncbi:MAG: hypothetical protein AB7V44_07630 [Pseudonocardia sp.]
MVAVPLTRSSYQDSTGSVREEPPTEPRESQLDQEQLVIAWGKVHGSGPHGWGIAAGLDVSATVDAEGLTVAPGIAIDALGQHISLAEGPGRALLVTSSTPVEVTGTGVAVPTKDAAGAPLDGPRYVTVEFVEFFDKDTRLFRHTPRVRLVAVEGFTDDGVRIVLALAQLENGIVKKLEAGLRRGGELPGQRLTLYAPVRGGSDATPVIAHQRVGRLASHPAGGLAIQLDDPAALLRLGGTPDTDGAPGTPTPLTVAAAAITARRTDGTPALRLDLATGAVDALTAKTLTATDAKTGTLTATNLTAGALTAGTLTATSLTAPTLTATNLTATNLTAPTLSANKLTAGDLTTTKLSTSTLSTTFLSAAGNINAGGQVDAGGFSTTGQSWLRGQVYTGGVLGHWDGAADLKLFGSDIWDNGDNWLQLRSGGGRTFLHGNATVAGAGRVKGEFVAEGNAWANGQFVVGGPTFLQGNARVDGEFVAKGNAWANGQFVVGGNTFLKGQVSVTGFLHKGGGGFLIDHPLAPGDRYLSHSFVESPDMANLYTGVVVTDDDGRATVSLPDYFEALNRDHRFQLTTIGALALATVEGGVMDNAFTVRTDKPGVTVSWQVTGVRQDPWAEANRVVVERDKPADERSRFLHPELYGHGDDRSFLPAAAPQASDDPSPAPAVPDDSTPPPASLPPEAEGEPPSDS